MRHGPIQDDAVPMVKTVAAVLADHGEALPDPTQGEALGEFFDRFGNASVVLLGEATHGTAEFYQARASMTRRLVERHGFTVVTAEGGLAGGGVQDGFFLRLAAFLRHPANHAVRLFDIHVGVAVAGAS